MANAIDNTGGGGPWLAQVNAALRQIQYGADGSARNAFGNAIGENPAHPTASMVILPSGEGKYLDANGFEVPYPGTQQGGAQWNAEQGRLAHNALLPQGGGSEWTEPPPYPGAAGNFGLAPPGTGVTPWNPQAQNPVAPVAPDAIGRWMLNHPSPAVQGFGKALLSHLATVGLTGGGLSATALKLAKKFKPVHPI